MLEQVVSVVWNARERRPRSLVRLVLAILTFVTVGVLAGIAIEVALAGFGGLLPVLGTAPLGSPGSFALGSLLSGVVTVVVLVVVGRFVDRRRVDDFGLSLDRDWWVDLGGGIVLGAAPMTLIFLAEVAIGWVRITGLFGSTAGGASFLPLFAVLLATLLPAAVVEELLVRGYLLTNVAEGLRGPVGPRAAVWIATALASLVFGAGHLANPNASVLSTASITLAGVWLALGYVLTGELGLPIGLHVSWNVFQGPVYGFQVSGIDFGASVLRIDQRGPELLTGGAFGPEGGLLGIAGVLLGAAATAAWVRSRRGDLRIDPDVFEPALRWTDPRDGSSTPESTREL